MCIHMQDGLYQLCKEKMKRDEAFLNLYPQETKIIDESTFSLYREYRLRQTLEYAYNNSSFYKELFDKHSIVPNNIDNIEDLKYLPFTEPQDIMSRSYDFLCISQGSLEKHVTFLSSGTTGMKKKVFFSNMDIQNILQFLSVGMRSVVQKNAIVHIILPNSNGRGIGGLLANSLNSAGMNAYATDMEWDSERQIQSIRENKPDVIFGNSRSIYRITKESESSEDLSKLGVKILFLTMEHTSMPAVQNLIKSWGCKAIQHYGLAEMGWGLAVECDKGGGYHYNELDVIAEVVDPATGEKLPDGAEGELVFTALGREAMPLIRYRTHDIGTLTTGVCGCGRNMQRIGYVNRRMESMIKLSEDHVIYPALLDDIIYKHDEVIDYRAAIDTNNGTNKLILEVEVKNKPNGVHEKIFAELKEFSDQNNLDIPYLQLLPKGMLRDTCMGKKLIRNVIV